MRDLSQAQNDALHAIGSLLFLQKVRELSGFVRLVIEAEKRKIIKDQDQAALYAMCVFLVDYFSPEQAVHLGWRYKDEAQLDAAKRAHAVGIQHTSEILNVLGVPWVWEDVNTIEALKVLKASLA
jgi:hypothetical protein